MEDVDVPRELASLDCIGGPFDMITASFFLGRQKLLASPDKPGMALWRERLFAWMSRSSESAMEFFKIPTNRSEEHTSELQSLMRISYAVLCLKKKKIKTTNTDSHNQRLI